jgi:hypothetical protein
MALLWNSFKPTQLMQGMAESATGFNNKDILREKKRIQDEQMAEQEKRDNRVPALDPSDPADRAEIISGMTTRMGLQRDAAAKFKSMNPGQPTDAMAGAAPGGNPDDMEYEQRRRRRLAMATSE